MRGLFVTGTDTGAGKTVLSASLLAAMAAAGEPVRAFKPVVTGLAEQPSEAGSWPPDHELLASAAGMSSEEVSPYRYPAAASPHLAARLVGETIDPATLLAHARRGGEQATLVVEGVGGLLVPLADDFSVRDLAVALELPVVIAARPGLGTINHSLLSIEAARAAGLRVAAVVLTPWPAGAGVLERSNEATIERLGAVEVRTLGQIGTPALGELAAAGEALPWQEWLADGEAG
jgi:dethiobiotin synthetase